MVKCQEMAITTNSRTINHMTEDWKKATNEAIANNLVDSIAKLLDAKSVRYFSCSDLRSEHKKIEITYDYKDKN